MRCSASLGVRLAAAVGGKIRTVRIGRRWLGPLNQNQLVALDRRQLAAGHQTPEAAACPPFCYSSFADRSVGFRNVNRVDGTDRKWSIWSTPSHARHGQGCAAARRTCAAIGLRRAEPHRGDDVDGNDHPWSI